MGMSNYILDNVEKFWDKAHEYAKITETAQEFELKLRPHEHLLKGSQDEEHLKEVGYDGLWYDWHAD